MTLRVTGGEARGRVVSSPRGREARPTSSKIRQAIFNILGTRVVDASFLDICAGSGIMGIEALSRGARALTAIEIAGRLAGDLETNLKNLNYSDRADVIVGDARKILNHLPEGSFDIIFADPPYQSPLCRSILPILSRRKILSDSGILMVEHAKIVGLKVEQSDSDLLELIDRRDYGQSSVSFFQFQSGRG
ncbi:MAG: 16S rRNA (guanine(966)-N(2))-methyltransferase RsmD [Cyanobacteria bacterium HKST-UBA02]|nr:16S rRNA (guanine(966)-N(2))-methyltransferase RsmD [Cyanobacteria bacterium HKST-UBA02]